MHIGLVDCEAVAFHHPLDSSKARFDQLEALAAVWLGPCGASGGEWRDSGLPLIVVRRLHLWTLPSLSQALYRLLSAPDIRARCKWVFEGDFDCGAPACAVVAEALGPAFARRLKHPQLWRAKTRAE